MTINEYLFYPMGKGFSAMLISDAREKMIEKFLLVESDIKVNLYKTGHSLVFHAEIPSKGTQGLFYDVIAEFPYNKADLNKGGNIFEFPFQVYSNCPSFVYTYAYVFNQHKLLCDWLKNRYDKKTLTMAPEKRNNMGIIFYEQSIFFTLYYIKKNFGMSPMELESIAEKKSYGQIRDNVTAETNIKSMRNEIKNALKKNSEKTGSRNRIEYEDGEEPAKGFRRPYVSKPRGVTSTKKPKKPKGTR